jgi:hypothetical protein
VTRANRLAVLGQRIRRCVNMDFLVLDRDYTDR